MELMEKVAYLKGMVDMAEFDPASKETKVLRALIDAVDEMAQTVAELVEANSQMCEVIESLDEDLTEVENDLYGEDEKDYDDDEDEDDEEDIYEVTCPSCGEVFEVDEAMLDEGEINCPACGELLEFDLQIDDPPAEDGAEGSKED
ncbi:MAG TPA: zinc ribbon domain-containing protein [Candidatus Faecivivens stercorigallinarum]|nr:zinc ribbon domain-containing protein [Candidatus Faecivivens stercorigallinarum]